MSQNSIETARKIASEHDAVNLRHAGIVDAIAAAIDAAWKHHASIYNDIVDAFDKDKTAIQFLREDGEGGFRAGVYRMAREIDRLWAKCGEPPERDPKWQDEEDAQIDADIDAMMAKQSQQQPTP